MLKDSLQREQATDPRRSFIVQAPAGSGKTEILTQRYLRLLGTVKAPEQIIALTFTRKAASEMRERIISVLHKVAAGDKATTPHQQQTFEYAALALARSEALDWQIIQQSGRLRVITIDSLCQMLSQAIPLAEQHIPFAQISEKPKACYQEAARACLAYALTDRNLQPALKCLLIHLDNRQDKLLDFLTDQLANREQWLPSLYRARQQDKAHFEQMLASIEQHELARFQAAVPVHLREELCSLAAQIALIENNKDSPRYLLKGWLNFNQINRDLAASLASLVLTSEDKLRKGLDHHVGLKRGSCDDFVYDNLKKKSQELFSNLDLQSDFLEALISVKNLPDPRYDSEQWEVLQALFDLLPFLVGHLQLVFSEHNEVDFAAVSQQALNALGDEDEPTDLALYLDNGIQHLLVDEFQDTSIQQFQLLTSLVQGWQPDDGRTLFVVGDPMQSIYRFRQAEVGLFLKAKQEGIGPVALTSLELCCNFRSTATLVNWVNQQFKTIFPQKDDIESGAISFHSSVNVQESSENSTIGAWQLPDRHQEAQAVVNAALEDLQNHPNDRVAILVRSRSQLTEIMAVLRERQIVFQGVDIELLAKLPHLRDLWSLTQALFYPANRLAWLALLRSPFCGLGLADLHLIANFSTKKSIYYALANLEKISALTDEGRIRAQFIYQVMDEALACRHQQNTADWIANTLKALHGSLILDPMQQADLEQFWLELERFTENGVLPDLQEFKNEFDKLYSQRVNHSRLQVMTIHKSKGLEFDCVILPGLGTKSRHRDQPLLRWLKLPSQASEDLLLVSPIKAAHREECLLYNYLAKLDAKKDSYESQRLLYVAATRAKKRLFLFDSKEKETKNSFRNLLKNQPFNEIDEIPTEESVQSDLPILSRLPQEFYLNPPPTTDFQVTQASSFPPDNSARQLGIVVHELLQWICDNHPTRIDDLPWPMVFNQFKSLGFSEQEQTEAVTLVRQQIRNLFEDSIGQWLCRSHEDERNEYELLVNEKGQAATRIIDRTFVENGLRWIIDFKTGSDLEEKQNHHRQQVNYYAELLAMRAKEPIRCGLYYLASGNWVEWEYSQA